MALSLGRMRGRLVGRRNGRRVAEVSCTQVVTGAAPTGNAETTACSGQQTLDVLRFTGTFPYGTASPTNFAFEITYAAGHWTGSATAPDGKTVAVDFWCTAAPAWSLKFTWDATTVTVTPTSVANTLSSFDQTYSGAFTYNGVAGTLKMEVTS